MHLRNSALAALTLIATPTCLSAQTSVDIVQIWQNFVASRAAARDCNALDPTTERHFLANLTEVSIRAAQALQERNPGIPSDQLVQRMDEGGKSINEKVNAEAKQNGCQSPKMALLLKLYKIHSTMTL